MSCYGVTIVLMLNSVGKAAGMPSSRAGGVPRPGKARPSGSHESMACSARIWRYPECVDLRFRQVKAEPHRLARKPGKVTAGLPAHGLTRTVRAHGHALSGSETAFSDHLDGHFAAVGLRVEEEMPPC